MDQTELVGRIRRRIEMCRRLAIETSDPFTANALIEMANEGEVDVSRILSENIQRDKASPPGELVATFRDQGNELPNSR